MQRLRSSAACAFSGLGDVGGFTLSSTSLHLSTPLRNDSSAATRSRRAFDNPLAGKDPALRSVMVPDTFHTDLKSELPKGADELRKRAMRVMSQRKAEELVWSGVTLKDTSSPLVEALRLARNNPKFRNSRKRVVAGGRLFLEELATKHKVFPETLLLPAGEEVPAWAENAQCEIIPVSKKVSESIDPGGDGYIGNFKMPPPPMVEELIGNKQRLERVLVLDNVTDPGNLGTLLRAAAGFAYDAVILTNQCADLYHHAVVRAARGVHFMRSVKIYVMREEDGDDAYAMVNHIIERNDLDTVAYTPLPFEASANRLLDEAAYPEKPGGLLPRSLFGTKPKEATAVKQKQASVYRVSGSDLAKAQMEGGELPTLSPSVYTNASVVPSPRSAPSADASLPASFSEALTTQPVAPSGQLPPPSRNAAAAKKLFNFMVDNFVSTAKPRAEHTDSSKKRHFRDKGFMLFAGPDVKCNLVRRLEQRVSKPTTVLQLDEPEGGGLGPVDDSFGTDTLSSLPAQSNGDLMTGLPSVMYALRPHGHWDYLLPSERHDPNASFVDSGRVQIGPDYVTLRPFNLTAEEQEALANEQNAWKKNKRIIRRQRTDEGFWLEAENNAAHLKGIQSASSLSEPLRKFTGEGNRDRIVMQRRMQTEGTLKSDIPDITSDFHETYDRDYLRHERDNAEQLAREAPTMYDKRMWYENSDGERWQ